MPSQTLPCLVVAAHGRQYRVRNSQGVILSAFTRGKKSNVACGDEVFIQKVGDSQAVIEKIRPRTSLILRKDNTREKLIAANCTQMAIILAVEPVFSDNFLSRALIAAHAANIQPLIVLNKIDLNCEAAKKRLEFYQLLNYEIIFLSALKSFEAIIPFLENQKTLFLGTSGVGKSSLLNAIFKKDLRKTGELSTFSQKGVHTTTDSQLYFLNEKSTIIDSPGLQQFGLKHLNVNDLANAFPEFKDYLGHCRFRNCQHLNEPNCAILCALKNKQIQQFRYNIFKEIAEELAKNPR